MKHYIKIMFHVKHWECETMKIIEYIVAVLGLAVAAAGVIVLSPLLAAVIVAND